MAKSRSESCCFESRFGGGWISSGQYLAEGMCDRMARSKKRVLPHRFWQSGEWKRQFLLQLRHANGLLNVYSCDAILKALRTPKGKRVYSLGAKFILDPLIQEQQNILDTKNVLVERAKAEESVLDNLSAEEVKEPPRPTFVHKNNVLSQLRDLE